MENHLLFLIAILMLNRRFLCLEHKFKSNKQV
jgi:hypothetical protein